MRIPCSTCNIDLNTYTVYDKYGNMLKNENNEVELEYKTLKQRINIFHLAYLAMFKLYIPIKFLKYIDDLSFIDTRDKSGFKDDFIVYSQAPIVSKTHPSYRWVARYPDLIVNKQGVIRSVKTGKIMNQVDTVASSGYYHVKTYDPLYRKMVYAITHRIVALAWCDGLKAPDAIYVNHIDGNKKNNKASNLEWVTASTNITHGYKNDLMTTNIACWSKDITTGDITSHVSLRDFNRKLGRHPATVVDRKTYYPGKKYTGPNGTFELWLSDAHIERLAPHALPLSKEYVLTNTETGEKQHIRGTINVERLTGKRVQVINRQFNTLGRNRMEFGNYVLELVSPNAT